MASCYPTISLPRLIKPQSRRTKNLTGGVAPLFDFLAGDFIIHAGKPQLVSAAEAFEQWVLKICSTERNTKLCYSDKIGTEFSKIPKMNDREAIKSHITRTLTEAILVHPRAKAVRDFTFTYQDPDSVLVGFVVLSDYGESRLEMTL